MNKKRLLLIAGLLVVLADAGFFIAQTRESSKASALKASFNHVKIGMNQQAVEAIFERPNDGLLVCEPGYLRWECTKGWAIIIVDQNGLVIAKKWMSRD